MTIVEQPPASPASLVAAAAAATTMFRAPTGKPGWPTIHLSGAEHAGKSFEVALFSASPVVGMTYVISFGETSSDMYGAVPGARYVLAEPRSFKELVDVVRYVVALPRFDKDRPNCIALDSLSAVWELVTAEAQDAANRRAADKAARFGKRFDPTVDYQVTADLWASAKDKWYAVLRPLLAYNDGPVIVTTRLHLGVVFENGEPTKETRWSPKAEKNIGFDTDVTIELRSRTERVLTRARSVIYQISGDFDPKPDEWGVEQLLVDLGVSQATVAPKTRTDPVREGLPPDWVAVLGEAEEALDRPAIKKLWHAARATGDTDALAVIETVGARVAKAAEAAAAAGPPPAPPAAAAPPAPAPTPPPPAAEPDSVVPDPAPADPPPAAEDGPEPPPEDDPPSDPVADGGADLTPPPEEEPPPVLAPPTRPQGDGEANIARQVQWRARFNRGVRDRSIRVVEDAARVARNAGWSALEAEARAEMAKLADFAEADAVRNSTGTA